MASTGSGWPRASRSALALLAAAALSLILASCTDAAGPAEVVEAYLSDSASGDAENALERWELSELGPAPGDIAPEQATTRVEGRRELAQALTNALAAAGDDVSWERSGVVFYNLADGIPETAENADEAQVATVEVALTLERGDEADVEETLAFTLWRRADDGWLVTGLDKGLAVLEEFLEELRSN